MPIVFILLAGAIVLGFLVVAGIAIFLMRD
jgi:hypothetical protein